MASLNRVIWIVLDSVGIGEAPDSYKFGDVGVDTLGHTIKGNPGLNINNMKRLGLTKIDNISFPEDMDNIVGCYGKLEEKSNGKDTTIGHWEMAGVYSPNPFPVYPDGFPDEVIDAFVKATGVPGVLCNATASGTTIINQLGNEHVVSKKPIVYTSADSVFQIACHEDVYSVEELYDMCRKAREILKGKHAVARVIARPFIGSDGDYKRTSNRRDFSLEPSEENVLCYVKNAGLDVIGVGKIEDIFAGVGITEAIHTKDNQDGIDVTIDYIKRGNKGIIYTNLVEFDSTWGHRRDVLGYGKGLKEFDERLPEIMHAMREDDILIITADHGCDPTYKGTDHTREYVPLLIYGKNIKSDINLGVGKTYADIAQTIAEIFGVKKTAIGTSFLNKII